MANFSIADICCPPSHESRRTRWFFLGLLAFMVFMIIFTLIGLMSGLWRIKHNDVRYMILSRKWPASYCIGIPCHRNKIKEDWLIHSFALQKEGNPLPETNCKKDQKPFEPKDLTDELKKKLSERWINLDQEQSKTSIVKDAKKDENTPTTQKSTTTTTQKSTTPTTEKPNTPKPVIVKPEDLALWKNQWTTYGMCGLMKQSDYFEAALKLDSLYPLNELKFHPGFYERIPLKNITNSIVEHFKHKKAKDGNKDQNNNEITQKSIDESMIEYVCRRLQMETGEWQYYLMEIRLCFHLDTFDPIECFDRNNYQVAEYDSPLNCFGGKDVIIPSLS